jgi:pyridoxamine 5'-phosphate oxidase
MTGADMVGIGLTPTYDSKTGSDQREGRARDTYAAGMSSVASVHAPLDLFSSWFKAAVSAGVAQPEAMALATASPDGRPSVRMVLFRGVSANGIRFFTNRSSRKGDQLGANPWAAAVFYWEPLGRQIRFEGRIEPLGAAEDDAYFAARPRGHQLAALASDQSHPCDPEALRARYDQLERQYEGKPVPRPAHWGGYRLVPNLIEFWTQRDNRLHDRLVFRSDGEGRWRSETVAP